MIESLVLLSLFALISMVFFQVYTAGTRLIIESKNRLGATALANQKMEIVRSLVYEDIGTKRWNGTAWVYGIPPGEILETEEISVNTTLYSVHTFVQYADDPYDGESGGSPNDAIPTDYKRVRIAVSWGGGGDDQEVVLFGTFAPNGIETSGGGGVLSINILDGSGTGVPDANVHIQNAASGVDLTATTDAFGNITLPGAPAGTNAYVLTVSKSGYYGVATQAPYPGSAYQPVDLHASVVADALNQTSIVFNPEVDLTLKTEDVFGNTIPNVSFDLSGGRLLGHDPSTGDPVYTFDESASTDGSGEYELSGESSGQYTFSGSAGGYEFFKFEPVTGSQPNILDAAPGASGEVKALYLDTAVPSVWVRVTEGASGGAVAGASVHLSGNGYDVTLTTDLFGYAFFPEEMPELAPGEYSISVTAAGYGEEDAAVTVDGGLVTEDVELTAN